MLSDSEMPYCHTQTGGGAESGSDSHDSILFGWLGLHGSGTSPSGEQSTHLFFYSLCVPECGCGGSPVQVDLTLRSLPRSDHHPERNFTPVSSFICQLSLDFLSLSYFRLLILLTHFLQLH